MMTDKRRYLPRKPLDKSKPIGPADEKTGSVAEVGYEVRSRAPLNKKDCDPCCWPPKNPYAADSLMDEREAQYSSYLKD